MQNINPTQFHTVRNTQELQVAPRQRWTSQAACPYPQIWSVDEGCRNNHPCHKALSAAYLANAMISGLTLLPIKMRMTVVDGFKTKSVADWAKRHIASGSAVISDGLACFKAVKEANCEHLGVVTGGNLDWLDHPAFNWVNTMIGNVKNSLRGSCHTLGAKHLPRHLAEYCFRFNHRFDLKSMLVELGHAVVASPPMPYRLLKLAEGHG